MNEDWEQVTPFLNEVQQHCTQDDYFNPQEVSFPFRYFILSTFLTLRYSLSTNQKTLEKNSKPKNGSDQERWSHETCENLCDFFCFSETYETRNFVKFLIKMKKKHKSQKPPTVHGFYSYTKMFTFSLFFNFIFRLFEYSKIMFQKWMEKAYSACPHSICYRRNCSCFIQPENRNAYDQKDWNTHTYISTLANIHSLPPNKLIKFKTRSFHSKTFVDGRVWRLRSGKRWTICV